jgi:hypothetical protein
MGSNYLGSVSGSIVFSRDGGEIMAENAQPLKKLYVPKSFFEALLEHFWSTMK